MALAMAWGRPQWVERKFTDVSHCHSVWEGAEWDLQRAQVAQGPGDQWCLGKVGGHHKGGVT